MMNHDLYRTGDAAYLAAGEYDGLKQLTDDFYQLMDASPDFKTIRNLHHEDLAVASEKLALFLSGYFNGPKLYAEKYGPFRLAVFHQCIPIGTAERDAWLACMKQAIDQQPWEQSFKDHALERLRTPAERCRNRP
jgi:hemoglobin